MDSSDYQLACIHQPVLPKHFKPPTQNATNLKLLGVTSLDLSPTIVARNLVALTRLLEDCKELSFQDGSNTVKNYTSCLKQLSIFDHKQSSVEKMAHSARSKAFGEGRNGSTFDLLPGSQVVTKRLKLQHMKKCFSHSSVLRVLGIHFSEDGGVADEWGLHCLFV